MTNDDQFDSFLMDQEREAKAEVRKKCIEFGKVNMAAAVFLSRGYRGLNKWNDALCMLKLIMDDCRTNVHRRDFNPDMSEIETYHDLISEIPHVSYGEEDNNQ